MKRAILIITTVLLVVVFLRFSTTSAETASAKVASASAPGQSPGDDGQPAPADKKVILLPVQEIDAGQPARPNDDASATGNDNDASATGNDDARFDDNAFPPPLPDTEWHREAWIRNDCMRCHETGVLNAPHVEHQGMPDILKTAKCRSCHVLIPNLLPRSQREKKIASSQRINLFDDNAFPPMMPNSESHRNAWIKNDCMLCHRAAIQGAPAVRHEGLPPILLKSKCRTCHVQVRAIEVPEVPKVGKR